MSERAPERLYVRSDEHLEWCTENPSSLNMLVASASAEAFDALNGDKRFDGYTKGTHQQYVRADIHDDVAKERDELREYTKELEERIRWATVRLGYAREHLARLDDILYQAPVRPKQRGDDDE